MTQAAFPKPLRSQIAFDIARTIRDGFDKHYRLFRATSQQAKQHFEQGAWGEAQKPRANASASTTSACRNACRCWKTSTIRRN
jgi:isocitrate dehydrogenase kinase/phosphatase